MEDLAVLFDWTAILSLVFGGCCSNVFYLEQLLASGSRIGVAITFLQFVVISALSLYPNTSRNSAWWKMYLRPPRIPLRSWAVQTVMFFASSLLNNLVLNYNFPIPLHIVLRSSGTVISILVGYFYGGKRYTPRQITSSVVMALGSVLASFQGGRTQSWSVDYEFLVSVAMMTTAALISAFLGLYNEQLFRQYGNAWEEGLFYTHFLGLPFFGVAGGQLKSELGNLFAQQKTTLAANLFTQYLCIKGVNRMAGSASSLTVNIVLLVRKFTSLILSVLLFGNSLSSTQVVGVSLVFGGAAAYSLGGRIDIDKKNR